MRADNALSCLGDGELCVVTTRDGSMKSDVVFPVGASFISIAEVLWRVIQQRSANSGQQG